MLVGADSSQITVTELETKAVDAYGDFNSLVLIEIRHAYIIMR